MPHARPLTIIRAAGAALLIAALSACTATPSRPEADGFAHGAGREPTPRTLHMLARLLIEQGKNVQAEYVLTGIIEQQPRHLPSYVALANVQASTGRLDHAVDTLQRAHEIEPGDPVIVNNLGLLYLQQSRYALALQSFDAAIEARPNDARYVANKALTLALLGRVEEARRTYELVVAPPQALVNVGVALEAVGKYPEAIAAYSQAVKLGADLETDLDVPEPIEKQGKRRETASASADPESP